MVDKRLFLLPNMKKMLVRLFGLAFLQGIALIGQAIGLSEAVVTAWKGRLLPWKWVIVFVIFFLLREIIIRWRNRIVEKFSKQSTSLLRKALLKKMFIDGSTLTRSLGTGRIVTTLLNGMDEVEQYIQLTLSKMLNMMTIPFLIDGFIWLFDPLSAFILLIAFPIIIMFMIILGKTAQEKANQQYARYQQLSNHFIDSLRGLSTLKYLGISKQYAMSVEQTSERFRKATMKTLRIGMLSSFALDFFSTLSIAIVAVFLGIRLLKGQMNFLPALIILVLSPEYFLPIRLFASDYHATLNGKNAFNAMCQILNYPNAQEESLEIHDIQKLSLKNVSIDYEDKQGLVDINLSFSGCRKVGIVGASGAGKSTLLQLLAGWLTPSNGEMELNEKKVSNFNIPQYHQKIGYISQQPYLFHGTLRDNIAFYVPDASDEELMQVVQQSGLMQWVQSLPNGLDTYIGSGERMVSGGERQRIALARVLLDSNRHILFFDEPTSHLDIETEMELKHILLPLMEDHLVFFATHRLHWMKEMDEIIVLKDGRIVEHGSYDELSQKNGLFKQWKYLGDEYEINE